MKRSSKGNFTVYEEEDICSLDEYSETLGEELEDKIEEVETEIEESAYDDTEVRETIQTLQTENTRLKATLPTTTGEGETPTLDKTAEMDFIQPPLPRGNSEQVQYSGKNKLDGANPTTAYGTLASFNNEIITVSSSSTLNVPFASWEFDVNEGDVVRINGIIKQSNGRIVRQIYNGTSWTGYTEKNYVDGSSISSLDYTVASGITKVRFNLYSNNVIPTGATSSSYQNVIVTVNNSDMTYEKYVGGTASPNPSYPQEKTNVTGDVEVLIQNKNLFDKDNANVLEAYINTTNKTIVTFANARTLYVPCKPNTTYVVSRKAGQRFVVMSTTEIPANNVIGTKEVYSNNATSLTITTEENDKYLAVFYYLSTADTLTEEEIRNSIQIEQGSTATTYTPHKQQTFTFPLGTQRMYTGSYLADDGIHNVRGQMVLDGSEDEIYTIELPTGHSILKITIDNMAKANNGIGLSSHFTRYSSHNEVIGAIAFGWINKTVYMYMPDTITSVVDFRTWLSNNNVTVEYELAEEEIIPYTTEQQEVYNQIKQAMSYEEQTNISGSSDEANPIFSVEGYQSLKLLLENIDSRLTIVES